MGWKSSGLDEYYGTGCTNNKAESFAVWDAL